MRCWNCVNSVVPLALAACGLISIGILQAEEPQESPGYAVKRAAARQAYDDMRLYDPTGPLAEDELIINQASSRRSKPLQMPLPVGRSPNLFAPDESKPLKPLAGEFSENPIWRADYLESWGTHPATPIPSHTPHWGVRIDDRSFVVPTAAEEPVDDDRPVYVLPRVEKAGNRTVCEPRFVEAPPAVPPQRGDAAKVILELMETLGRSVLDGTVFQKEDKEEQEWLKELSADGQVSPREALIQYIRMLEAHEEQARKTHLVCEHEDCELFFGQGLCRGKLGCQDECAACPDECSACARIREIVKGHGGCAANCECDDCPAGCQGCPCGEGAPCLCDAQASNIEVLRDMSAHLDMAAHELERRELYDRADQLREVSSQLRQDARQTSLARAAKKTKGGSTQATRDVYTQLRMLQEELRRTREELEQARQQHFPPYR